MLSRIFVLSSLIVSTGFPEEKVPLAGLLEKADPLNDQAWSSEAFSQQAGEVLKELAGAFSGEKKGSEGEGFAEVLATPLRPQLIETFRSSAVTVSRPLAEIGGDEFLPLSRSLNEALQPFREQSGTIRHKFKITRVLSEGGKIATRTRLELIKGNCQVNAVWLITWLPQKEGGLKMEKVRLLDYEEVLAARAELFQDATKAVLGQSSAYQEQLLFGADHWSASLDVAFGIGQGNQGLALGDFNSDGLEDLYLCEPAGLPNRLFIRQADGTLRDQSAASGLDLLDLSRCPLLVDLDNDGDQDFVLSHQSSLSLYRNDGVFPLVKVGTFETGSRLSGVSAADYDNDGDLDLYVCGYAPSSQTSPEDIFANPVPYYDALNGAFNHLLRNDGGFAFIDATKGSGFDQLNTRFSFTASWADYDTDGDMDVYVANDFGKNNLFQNQLSESGRAVFIDVATKMGVDDIGAGMSVDWGDPNNDGRLDLYVANMWSSAGGRIAYQNQFKEGVDEETRRKLQRHARGNSLFLQTETGGFRDESLTAQVEMGRWAWGSLFVDLDNNGWQDIYTTNGFMTAPDTGDL